MPLVDYECSTPHLVDDACKNGECKCEENGLKCKTEVYSTEIWFTTTEVQPKVHPDKKCKICGGKLVRGLNLKNNCQVWSVNRI